MSAEGQGALTQAQVLRDAFDRGFAASSDAPDQSAENVLALRVGGGAYAVLLGQTGGLFTDRKIVPLPGKSPAFLGITCLRTGIMPVYSLRAFLGYPPAKTPARWLVSAGQGRAIALAFDDFETYARVLSTDFSPTPVAERKQHGHIQATALIAGERRSVISLDSILQAVADTP